MNRREFLRKGLAGVVIAIPLNSGCGKNPVGSERGSGVNIYFLKDENLTFKDVMEQPLSNLELHWKPWITSDDIERYDWSAHLIYLKKEMPLSLEGISTFGKPFVVTANEEKCYLGYLYPAFSSWYMPTNPSIWIPAPYPDDIIHIEYTGELDYDPRNDLRIKEALIAKGQFYDNLNTYIVDTIHGLSVEDFSKKIGDYDLPLAIMLTDYQLYPEVDYSNFEGSVKLVRLGWQIINNYSDYAGKKNSFYIYTKGKLDPVEHISFYIMEINETNMRGIYTCTGPTIDTPSYEFTAISMKNLLSKDNE